MSQKNILIIACGALAREIIALCNQQGLKHITLKCLPAQLHNFPEKIAPAVEDEIIKAKQQGFQNIFVAYADCGTGGILDKMLLQYHIKRLPGPHCYALYTGVEKFLKQHEDDMYSFFLTDFLARQFQSLVIEALGLDKYPELRDSYFGAYRKLVYLAQTDDSKLDALARSAARKLNLAYERRSTGYGDLFSHVSRL